jgi:hypothetical protein
VNEAGLSYQQAPPFGAPLRFFLVAPLFLLAAAALALFQPDWLSSRWSPAALALTHLITLGYLGMIMLGALLQILPVVLGVPVPAVGAVAWTGLLALACGTPCLAVGFLLSLPASLHAGMLILAIGLPPVLLALAISLARSAAPLVAWPIRLAVLALAVTLTLGIAHAGGLYGVWPQPENIDLTPLHVAWGLVGWILALVIGVAYQVVPMLQITPPYPGWLSRWLNGLILAGLLLFSWPAQSAWGAAINLLGEQMLAAAALAFALATLHVQARRRRKVADITLDFWRLGMACLILAAPLYLLHPFLPESGQEGARISLGAIFLLGFAVSVVSGMLYKIVPFLAWFHLKTQTGARIGEIPNMKEMIPDKLARQHFQMHLAALALLLPAPFLPAPAARLVGSLGLALAAAGAIRQGLNLLHARRLFLRFGGKLG